MSATAAIGEPFVPADFEPPAEFEGDDFRLEPLGAEHNERDHVAWMSSIDHIRGTPGFEAWGWPVPMSLEENRRDLEQHAREFHDRSGFTYSILDGDDVIGCLYIYPSSDGDHDAHVRSWVTADRSAMDIVVWRVVSRWLREHWPFERPLYVPRIAEAT